MSEAHDFREDLLLAWLHDPFDKALTVQGHESRARRYASAALGENVSRQRLRRLAAQADVFAAVAERVPLPTAGPDGLRAVGPEDGLRIVHPCSGAPADLRPCSLDPDRAAAVIGKLVGGLSGPRERFLAIWRLLPDAVAVEFGDDMARLPADTRIPDHTLFQNTDITAGLYASGAQDGKAAFLSFTLGPVQPFIGAARSVRDLWTRACSRYPPFLASFAFRINKLQSISRSRYWNITAPPASGMNVTCCFQTIRIRATGV